MRVRKLSLLKTARRSNAEKLSDAIECPEVGRTPSSAYRRATVALLEVDQLSIEFRVAEQWLRVVDGVSFHLNAGELLCLVGESGSGKSVTALSLARLLPCPPARFASGAIRLDGREVLNLAPAQLEEIRGKVISYVFQEPSASLNPVMRVGSQILEGLRAHRPTQATEEEVVRLLRLVGIPTPEVRQRSYPFELSGGMQQRVMIAMALASEPKIVIADEPTTALDTTIQAQILDLLRDIKQRLGTGVLLITHHLGIVGEMADRVAVMYAGQIVEMAPSESLLNRPLHPYTAALIRSVPRVKQATDRLLPIPGAVPRPGHYPKGCRFAPRCPSARPECFEQAPLLRELTPGRFVRCTYADQEGAHLKQ